MKLETSTGRSIEVGGAGGNAFDFPEGKVAGFFGGVGGHLHNLNVFYEKSAAARADTDKHLDTIQEDEVVSKSKEKKPWTTSGSSASASSSSSGDAASADPPARPS